MIDERTFAGLAFAGLFGAASVSLLLAGPALAGAAETAIERAQAFIGRAGAELDRGAIDPAIADAGEAIKLTPQNAAAYVVRSLAYYRKGDRDRAVIDFAVAARLDTGKTDETAAANPILARIAALARGSPPAAPDANAAARAGPFCPTGETARLGFVLVDHKRERRQEVHPSDGDVATNEYFVGGERAMSATYYKGLLILFASFLDSYINSYDIDYTQLSTYRVGQETRYHTTSMTLDGKVRQATVERRVTGVEKLSIGDCAFDTYVIESQTSFPDGSKTVARSDFSPALKMSLRLTSTTAGAEPSETKYDAIEPLSK